MERIILASASPRRKELLEQIGLVIEIMPSHKEERIRKHTPGDIVLDLSKQKAQEVAQEVKGDAVIIGADTVVVFEDIVMGKPHSEQEAYHMLTQISGHTHTVYTGVTAIRKQGETVNIHSFFEATHVTIYPMTEAEIWAYVRTGDPMDKAGAYGIQGLFAKYIQRIDGEYNNVVGLPLGRLYQEVLRNSTAVPVMVEYCNLPMREVFKNSSLRNKIVQILQLEKDLNIEAFITSKRTFNQFVLLDRRSGMSTVSCEQIFSEMAAEDIENPYPLAKAYPFLNEERWSLSMKDISYMKVNASYGKEWSIQIDYIECVSNALNGKSTLYFYPFQDETCSKFQIIDGKKVLQINPRDEKEKQEILKSILLKGTVNLNQEII